MIRLTNGVEEEAHVEDVNGLSQGDYEEGRDHTKDSKLRHTLLPAGELVVNAQQLTCEWEHVERHRPGWRA